MSNFENRNAKFSDAEFANLARNSDGDVINLYEAHIWMNADQKALLSGDDQSRVDDYEEELRIMMAEFEGEI